MKSLLLAAVALSVAVPASGMELSSESLEAHLSRACPDALHLSVEQNGSISFRHHRSKSSTDLIECLTREYAARMADPYPDTAPSSASHVEVNEHGMIVLY